MVFENTPLLHEITQRAGIQRYLVLVSEDDYAEFKRQSANGKVCLISFLKPRATAITVVTEDANIIRNLDRFSQGEKIQLSGTKIKMIRAIRDGDEGRPATVFQDNLDSTWILLKEVMD